MPVEFAPPQVGAQPFNVTPVQYQDPLETLSRMQQMKTQNLQQQQAQLGLQQAQMQMASNRAMMNAFVKGGGDRAKTRQLIMTDPDILPNDRLGFDQHALTIDTQQAGLTEKQQTIRQNAADLYKGIITASPVADQGDLNARNVKARAGYVPEDMLVTTFPVATPDHSAQDQLTAHVNLGLAATQRKKEEQIETQIGQEKAATAASEASTKKTGLETAGLAKQQLITDVRAAEKDPTTGTLPTPAAWAAIRKNPAYKDLNLPEQPTQKFLTDLTESQIPEKDIPEYRIKQAEANAIQAYSKMSPQDLSAEVDQIIPPTDPMSAPTKALVQRNASLGNFAGVRQILKDAYDQMGRVQVAAKTAQITAPIKVSVAAAEAGARADAAGLTQDDYNRAGEQYARTGVMPALGRDSITRGRVVKAANQWARDNGLSPSDVITMQAAYAGDKESLKKFQAQRDQIVSFEQTAQKNLDLFLGLAAKIPDTGVPWLNTPLRSLSSSVVGSENMAAVNAARQIANNEIAKVTSGGGLGGVLSDSARHEVEAYNPANATFAQTKAVANILKQDMANRHGSMDATLSDIKSRIGGGATGAGTSAPPLPAHLTQDDVGKVYLNKAGKQIKITKVNPQNPTQFLSEEVR